MRTSRQPSVCVVDASSGEIVATPREGGVDNWLVPYKEGMRNIFR